MENAKVTVAEALARTSMTALITAAAVGSFVAMLVGLAPDSHIDAAEKFALLTAGTYIGKKGI